VGCNAGKTKHIYIYILNTINFHCFETFYRAQNTTEDRPIALSKSILQLSIQDFMCVRQNAYSHGKLLTQTVNTNC